MMRPLLLLVVLSGAIASHFRFGTMSWKNTTVVNEVEFTITLSWRRSAFPGGGQVCAGTLSYGDGGSKQVCIDRTAESSAEDWVLGSTKMKKTYSAPNNNGNPWVASVNGCCRISNLMVLANQKHDIQAALDLDQATESPIMQQLPVLYMFTNGGSPTFNVALADAFGRVPSLTLLHSGSPVTLNNLVATVDVSPGKKGWWPVGLRATFRGGFIPVDFIIIIKDPVKVCTGAGASCKTCSGDSDCAVGTCQINSNPVTTIDPGLCFIKGQESVFTVVATDANPCQRITIQNGGLPSGASIGKANQSISPVERKVTWTPPSNANQIVCFSSYNNNGGYSSSVCALMKIGATGAAPVITSFSPAKVTKSGGAVIEIAGTGMDSLAGGECTFGTKVVIAQFVSDTKVICQVPTMATGLYDVKYRALPCGIEKKISTQIELTQTPTVSSVSPANNKAPNGFDSLEINLTISGSSFTTASSGVVTDPKCKVGSTIFSGVIVNAGKMTCAVKVTSAGTYLLSTSNDGDSFSNAYAFLVYELPGITGFDDGTDLAPSTGGLAVALGSQFTEGSYCRLDISSVPYYYKPQVVVSGGKIKCRLPPLEIPGGPTAIAVDNSTKFDFFVCGQKAATSCSDAMDVGYYQNTPGEVSAVSVSEGDGCTGVINVTVGNLDPMLGRLKCKFDANIPYIVEGDWLVGDVVACRVPTDIAVGDYKLKVTNDGKYFSEGGSTFKVTVVVPLVAGWIGGGSTNNRGERLIKVVVKNVASGVDAVISLGGSDSDGDSDGEASELSFNLTGSTESLGSKIVIEVTPPAFDIPVGIFSALYLPVTVTVAGKTSCGEQMLKIYSECYSDTQCSNEGVCDQLTGRCLPSPCGIMCEKCEPTMITSGINFRTIDACGKCNRETGKCECIDGWGDLACTAPTCKKVGDFETGGKLCPGSVTYDDCSDDPSLAGRQVCQKACDIQMKTGQTVSFGAEYCPAEKATCNTNFFKFCECDEGWTGYKCDIEIIEAPPPTPYVQPTCTRDNPNVCGSRFATTCNPDLKCATTCDTFSLCETGTCTEVSGEPSYCKCGEGQIGLECEMAAPAGGDSAGGAGGDSAGGAGGDSAGGAGGDSAGGAGGDSAGGAGGDSAGGAGGSDFSASARIVASPFLALLSACVVLI